MDRDLRRLDAVMRDELALRLAVAEQERRRFDLDAVTAIRARTEDLLETLSFVAHDDDFWDRLADGARVMTFEQLQRLRDFDPASLAIVLEAAGYRNPPPPPVDELVEDTAAALASALAADQPPSPADVTVARSSLITLVMRVRRQVELPPSLLTPAADRGAARALLRGARVVLPIAAGAAAGALIESLAPGSGIGLVVGKAAAAVADHGIGLGAVALLGLAPNRATPPPPPVVDDRYVGPTDAIQAHYYAASSAVTDAAEKIRPSPAFERMGPDPDKDVEWYLHVALRHVRRIRELAADHAAKTALTAPLMEAEEALTACLVAMTRRRGTADAALLPDLERASDALRAVSRAKGDRVDYAGDSPTLVEGQYSMGPFAAASLHEDDAEAEEQAVLRPAAQADAEEHVTDDASVIGATVEQKTGTAEAPGLQLRRRY